MNKTFIYTLSHPITNEIRYVGKTINLKERYHKHTNKKISEKLSNKHLGNWLLSILNKDLKPILEILEECDENWVDSEIYWISQFKSWGFRLLNISKGGDGFQHKHTEITKKKLSESHKGKKFTDLHKENISKGHIGFKYTDEQKEKMSKSRKESPLFKESMKNLHNSLKKPIMCIEDNLKFDSMQEAAKYYNISSSCLANKMNNKTKNLKNGKTFKFI
jgi:group I intron endonuclease